MREREFEGAANGGNGIQGENNTASLKSHVATLPVIDSHSPSARWLSERTKQIVLHAMCSRGDMRDSS